MTPHLGVLRSMVACSGDGSVRCKPALPGMQHTAVAYMIGEHVVAVEAVIPGKQPCVAPPSRDADPPVLSACADTVDWKPVIGVLQDQLLSVHTAGSVVMPLRKAIRDSVIIQQQQATGQFYAEVESLWKLLTNDATGSKIKLPMADVATTICGWATHTQLPLLKSLEGMLPGTPVYRLAELAMMVKFFPRDPLALLSDEQVANLPPPKDVQKPHGGGGGGQLQLSYGGRGVLQSAASDVTASKPITFKNPNAEAKLLLNNKHAEMEAYLKAYCEQVYCGADLTRSKQLAIVVALFNIREGRSSNAQCKLSDVVPAFINAMVTGSMRGSRAMTLAYWWTGYGTAERATACAQGDATKPQGECGLVNNAKQRRLGSAIKCAYCNKKYWDKSGGYDGGVISCD